MPANVFSHRLSRNIDAIEDCAEGQANSLERRHLKALRDSVALMERNEWCSNPGWHPEYLRRFGPAATVIDVGVLDGTPELYEAFPASHHVLIEPISSYETACRKWLRTLRGEYHCVAAGARDGSLRFNVCKDKIQVSSATKQLNARPDSYDTRSVPVRRLDTLLKRAQWEQPFIIKIDTDGFELEVIKGSEETLKRTTFVIAEVSVAERHAGSYRFADFVFEMSNNGFRLCEILRVMRRERHRDIGLVDAVFKPYPKEVVNTLNGSDPYFEVTR